MNLFKQLVEIFNTSGKLEMQGILSLKHFVPDPSGAIVLDGVRCREIKKTEGKSRSVLLPPIVSF